MKGTRAASRYAKAILETARSKGVEVSVDKDMTLIASTVASNAELRDFIQNPVISADKKESAFAEIFADVDPVTRSLFTLLLSNNRFEIIDDVALQYNSQFNELSGVEVAKVTTAIPMDSEMESKVRAKISTFSDKKINIVNIVDPSIIGGFILRIGDQQYNASVSNRLQTLKREFAK